MVEHYENLSRYSSEGTALRFAVKIPAAMVPMLDIGVEEWEEIGWWHGSWEFVDGGIGVFEGRKARGTKDEGDGSGDGGKLLSCLYYREKAEGLLFGDLAWTLEMRFVG